MMVMTIASTPSLKASSRPLFIRPSSLHGDGDRERLRRRLALLERPGVAQLQLRLAGRLPGEGEDLQRGPTRARLLALDLLGARLAHLLEHLVVHLQDAPGEAGAALEADLDLQLVA